MSSDTYASIFSLLIYVPLYISDQYKDAVTEVLIIEYELVYEKFLINNIKPCRVPSAVCRSQMSQAEE